MPEAIDFLAAVLIKLKYFLFWRGGAAGRAIANKRFYLEVWYDD